MTGRELARQALANCERSRRWPWSELAYGKAASVGGLFIPNVTCWPIASFRCAAEVGRYGGISIYENASSADVLPNLQLQPRIFSHQISSIEAVARARHLCCVPQRTRKARGAHKKGRPRAS